MVSVTASTHPNVSSFYHMFDSNIRLFFGNGRPNSSVAFLKHLQCCLALWVHKHSLSHNSYKEITWLEILLPEECFGNRRAPPTPPEHYNCCHIGQQSSRLNIYRTRKPRGSSLKLSEYMYLGMYQPHL